MLCGSNSPTDVHHIVSRAQGGKSELCNLATLCRSCHNAAHGVNAKEIRAKLLEIIKERTNTND
ncbi:HNH endonuclease [Veillonella seminalis]|uniref:HNH endonuclease n=1 Tax=Veillonella seminalis TaxID=1502943 RepID=UPI001CE4912F|nr:MAG TPA: HNH endonuclease [Caudoviricetes sp.]